MILKKLVSLTRLFLTSTPLLLFILCMSCTELQGILASLQGKTFYLHRQSSEALKLSKSSPLIISCEVNFTKLSKSSTSNPQLSVYLQYTDKKTGQLLSTGTITNVSEILNEEKGVLNAIWVPSPTEINLGLEGKGTMDICLTSVPLQGSTGWTAEKTGKFIAIVTGQDTRGKIEKMSLSNILTVPIYFE